MVDSWLRVSCKAWLLDPPRLGDSSYWWLCEYLEDVLKQSLSFLETLFMDILTHYHFVHVVWFIRSQATLLLYLFSHGIDLWYLLSRSVHRPSQYDACPQHSTGNNVVNFADLILFSHLTRVDAEKEKKTKTQRNTSTNDTNERVMKEKLFL